MRINCFNHRNEIKKECFENASIVVIDVLRATSVMVSAIANGVKEIIPVLSIEEAFDLKEIHPEYLLAGERNALKVDGFDLGNSPLEVSRDKVEERTLVMSTTNGTATIKASDIGEPIFILSYRNRKAIAKHLKSLGKDVVIVCSGTNEAVSNDDVFCAGALIDDLMSLDTEVSLSDMAGLAKLLYDTGRHQPHTFLSDYATHYRKLLTHDRKVDLSFCFDETPITCIPVYENGRIRRLT